MDLKKKLLEFLINLPEVDSPDKRKALISLTGFSHLGVYLDWQGSNVAFFPRLLEEFGRRGKSALAQFLGELQKQPHVGVERQEIVGQMRREVETLSEEAWQQRFAVAAPADTAERVLDPDMLATSVFSTVLTPYFKLGAEELRQKAGHNAVSLAERAWQRVEAAFSADHDSMDWLDVYRTNPEKWQEKLIPRLSRRIAEDATLGQQLADLLARADAEDEAALRTLINVAQDAGTVKGELVGAIFGQGALPQDADVGVNQKIGEVGPGGSAVGVVMGGNAPINVGGQHTHGDQVTGDKFEGDQVAGDKFEGDQVTGDKIEGNKQEVDTSGGDFIGRDKRVHGDEVGGDKFEMGDISGSGVAIGRGASTTVHQGDKIELSGDFRGAIVNLKSRLDNVSHTVQNVSHGNEAERQELAALIAELRDVLANVPAERTADAEKVMKRVEALARELEDEEPDEEMVAITGKSLKRAAQDIADVLPAVAGIATKIVSVALAFV